MLKLRHIALVACLASPFAVAAEKPHADRPMVPPPGAFEACAGKKAGAKVELPGRDGKRVAAVCRAQDGKLMAHPEQGRPDQARPEKGRPDQGRPEHDHRDPAHQAPPPGGAKACAGKRVGDKVSMSGPDGKSHAAVCREMDGKLMPAPEHMGKPSEYKR